MTNEILTNARKGINNSSTPEVLLLEENSAVLEMWQSRQELIAQMNQEIAQAIEVVRTKYQSELDLIESDYGTYLQMITPAGSNDDG